MTEPTAINQLQRQICTFTFPDDVKEVSGYATVSIKELSPSDELRAARRAEQDPISLAFEMAKESVCASDQGPISTSDQSCDLFWVKIGPVGRNLVLQAYTAISSPTKTSTKSFLESRVVKVG